LSYLPIAHDRVLAFDAVAQRRLQCGRMNGKQSYSNASRGRQKSRLSSRLAPLDAVPQRGEATSKPIVPCHGADADVHRHLGSGEKKDHRQRRSRGCSDKYVAAAMPYRPTGPQ
jgi:hypothetical protein